MKFYNINSNMAQKLLITLFALLSLWWVYISIILKNESIPANLLWAASYQLMAIAGIFFGLMISKSWGGFKSLMGKTIIFFCVGLAFQVFGQSVFSYYNLILKVDIPYPSIADIGYFISIPIYAYATILLAKASGAGIALKSTHKKLIAVIIPLIILVISYLIFIQGNSQNFDWTNKIEIFLDFGYPLGQAFYVSLAFLAYLLSKNFLGGLMKPKVLIVLFALIVQYTADYNFLSQANYGTWINGSYGDYIYLISYFLMAMALVNLGNAFEKIKENN